MTNLPTTKGERVVFWTEDADDHGGEPSRGVLISDGAGAWTIDFEIGIHADGDDYEHADDDGMVWESGGVFRPGDIVFGSGFLGALTMLFVDCNRTHSSLIEAVAKGKAELPTRKPVTLVKVTGKSRFTVKLTSVDDDSYGQPLMQIEQSRPLIAEELFVVCKRLAMASDWWAKRMA
jgi:hypothetical protein